MNAHINSPCKYRTQGFALLEVLIAVLVLSIGLLGTAALQASALRNNQSSLERSMAVAQSYAILDAIRASAAEARMAQPSFAGQRQAATAASAAYNRNLTDAIPAAGGTLVGQDQHVWLMALQSNLNPKIGRASCRERV